MFQNRPPSASTRLLSPARVEQVFEAVPRIAEEVVRVLVDLPILHGREDELAAGLEHARHLGDADVRFLDVLEHLNIDHGIEDAVAERELADVALDVDVRVVPGHDRRWRDRA